METRASYKHGEIIDKSIRLLHLEKTDAVVDGQNLLRGILTTVDLDETGSFDALSYACGGQEATEYILIGDQKFKITQNCRDGLRHLRTTCNVRVVWVDSLCIAPDLEDKAVQLPLMTDIYGKAQTVYIWLGRPHPDGLSERGLNWLNDVSRNESPFLGVKLAQFPKNMLPREIAKTLGLLPRVLQAKLGRSRPQALLVEDDLNAVRDIVGRQYFTRVWTMQESAMAERPVVVCGEAKISWNSLAWGIIATHRRANRQVQAELWPAVEAIATTYSLWLEIVTESELRMSKHRKWIPEHWRIYKTWISFLDYLEVCGLMAFRGQVSAIFVWIATRLYLGLRPFNSGPLAVLIVLAAFTVLLTPPRTDLHWDQRLKSGFVNLLSSVRKQKTTDARDKVYALCGILHRLGIDLPKADYTPANSVEETYISFTHAVIQWQGSLQILNVASGVWGIAPSWVADWRQPNGRLRLPLKTEDSAGYASDPTDNRLYAFSEDLRQLTIPAQILGKIVVHLGQIEPTTETLDSYRINVSVLRQWLQDVKVLLPMTYAATVTKFLASLPISTLADSDESKLAIFKNWIHILEDDRTADGITDHNPPTQSIPLLPTETQELTQLLRTQMNRTLDTAEYPILLNLLADPHTWHLHQSICSLLSGQQATFFIAQTTTPASEYALGLGPPSCKVGDTLFFLQTLKNPMVLRAVSGRKHGNFHLVGPAHVPAHSCAEIWEGCEDRRQSVTLV